MHVQIYQMKDTAKNAEYLYFRPYELVADMINIQQQFNEYYALKYEYDISNNDPDTDKILSKIFTRFNTDMPDEFHGHSLSVSDIVALNNKRYYCDTFSWIPIDT